MKNSFDIATFPVERFDQILNRGLSNGLGEPGGQVCIEAAICESLGLPHGDDPGCVAAAVRGFKIALRPYPRGGWNGPSRRKKSRVKRCAMKGCTATVFCTRCRFCVDHHYKPHPFENKGKIVLDKP